MKSQVTATFLDGVLRPDESLGLSNHARVSLTIEPLENASQAAAAWEALKQRIRDRPVRGGGHRFTRDELHERD
jgi:hypothetical protein